MQGLGTCCSRDWKVLCTLEASAQDLLPRGLHWLPAPTQPFTQMLPPSTAHAETGISEGRGWLPAEPRMPPGGMPGDRSHSSRRQSSLGSFSNHDLTAHDRDKLSGHRLEVFLFTLWSPTSLTQLPKRKGTHLAVSASEMVPSKCAQMPGHTDPPGEGHSEVLRHHAGGEKARCEGKDCWVHDPCEGNWFLSLSLCTPPSLQKDKTQQDTDREARTRREGESRALAEGEASQVCRATKPERRVLLGFPGAKREMIAVRRSTVNGINGVFNSERQSQREDVTI